MTDDLKIIIAGILAGVGFGGGGVFLLLWIAGRGERAHIKTEREELEKTRTDLRKESEGMRELVGREVEAEVERRLEKELSRRKNELQRTESKIRGREEAIEREEQKVAKKVQAATEREEQFQERIKATEAERGRLVEARQELTRKAEEVAGLSREDARKLLLESLETELDKEKAAAVRRVEAETKEISDKKARQIISLAIERIASDHTSESTVSVVQLPNEEMKGRIIGREGRNIRSLEQLTGVNIIIDDTPEAVVLSCFDPMRREAARLVVEALVADGRIHPARIEELVQKSEAAVLETARVAAENACLELGIHDLHPELVKLMGRLRFRTSYGQNVLAHSVECAHVADIISSELGLDARLAKRATFLHDIGKAVSHEVEGTHASIGANLAKKYRERPEVVHAIEAHHYETEPKTLTAIIVIASDAISASRPGARRESLESYIKRLESLEAVANAFEGVERSYAIQAGREVRIIVKPEKLSDDDCTLLARDVAKKIETDMQYPGQIKVTVLREIRRTEYAR